MKDKTFRIVGWAAVVVFTLFMWWLMLRPAFASSPIQFGYSVTTIHPTNVVVGYRLHCWNDDRSRRTAERFEASTPLEGIVTQNMLHPTHCHLTVVAWDTYPHVHPHSWPAPFVATWRE